MLDFVEVHGQDRRPNTNDFIGPGGLRATADDHSVQFHFGRNQPEARSDGLQCVNVFHRLAGRLVLQMTLIDGNIFVADDHLVQAAHRDEGFLHSILHALYHCGHRYQAGHAKDDAKHSEEGTEFVCPDVLQSDEQSGEEFHDSSLADRASSKLIIAERLNGMKARRFERREQTGRDSHADAASKSQNHRADSYHRRIIRGSKGSDHLHEAIRHNQSKQSADDGDDDALDQDLNKHVLMRRADGLANANLAHALGNAGKHDVHNADSADDQANARNNAPAHARILNRGSNFFGLVFLRPEGEIFNPFMVEHQNISRLLEGWFQNVHTLYLQIEGGQPRVRRVIGAAGGAEFDEHRVEGDIHGVVFHSENPVPTFGARPTGASIRAFLLRHFRIRFGQFPLPMRPLSFIMLKHADDRERLVVDVYDFANGDDLVCSHVGIAKQLITNAGADDAHTGGASVVDFIKHAAMLDDVFVDLQSIWPRAGEVEGTRVFPSITQKSPLPKPVNLNGRIDALNERRAALQGINVVERHPE